MVDAKIEIERLRGYLLSKGLDSYEADMVCDSATYDIEQSVADILDNAIREAVWLADSEGVREFLEQLHISESNGTFTIGSVSGKTDFSRPATPMLNNLLKNAKTAKDGSRYKTIPLRGSSDVQRFPVDMFSFIEGMNSQRKSMRDAKRDRQQVNYTNHDPFDAARNLAANVNVRQYMPPRGSNKKADVEFKTATSKQDPTTRWVIPAKDADLTPALADLNRKMEQDIQFAVYDVIRSYQESA